METETATRWLNDAEQCAWRTHLDVSRLLTHQLEKDLQPFGLTMNDYEILVNLSESDDQRMRMSDLATATLQSKSRLSHQITRMESAGWSAGRTASPTGAVCTRSSPRTARRRCGRWLRTTWRRCASTSWTC